ncbi:MAG TPA: energy-coupling factor transporter transmembrane component T [Ruminiclostridium sp.]|nr:energy-coupling factor transporter transmembrane component T [Ruminiclostridium sp.]
MYLDKNTYMHRLDPRTKMMVMLASFTAALMFSSIPGLLIIALLVIAYGLSGKTFANLKRIKIILVMISLFSIVIWSIMGQGATKIIGPLTWEGLLYGVATGIKLDVMIISGMIFLSSTKIEEISLGLQKLKIPYRVAFAFSTAIRLVPMIAGTTYIISQAQRSRGLDLDSGHVLTRIKKYIPLLIPVFISVIRGTNVFAMALESKGFGYSSRRSSYLQSDFKPADIFLSAATILLLLGSTYLKLTAGW